METDEQDDEELDVDEGIGQKELEELLDDTNLQEPHVGDDNSNEHVPDNDKISTGGGQEDESDPGDIQCEPAEPKELSLGELSLVSEPEEMPML